MLFNMVTTFPPQAAQQGFSVHSVLLVYASEIDASPFSGGIISPYIVVPKGVWESLDEKSRDVIIRAKATGNSKKSHSSFETPCVSAKSQASDKTRKAAFSCILKNNRLR